MSTSFPDVDTGPSFVNMTDEEWDVLVDLIADRGVVPVLGPELLVVPDKDGKPTHLYEVWGRMLAEKRGIKRPAAAQRWTVFDVANLLSQHETGGSVAYHIDDVVHRRPGPIPVSLQKLAGIQDFSLYIKTTVDHLMLRALSEDKGRKGSTVREMKFDPNGTNEKFYLPEWFDHGRTPGVYHLFGASSSTDGTFAKTEDDLIEYSWRLLDQAYRPNYLYDYLRKKTVLLLGCSLPDWLGRFFIYALNGCSDQGAINMYYVSLGCETGLAEYLNRRRAKVITSISPVDFVDQLYARWQARSRRAPIDIVDPALVAPEFKNGAVFLSYASEDREIVRKVRDQLEENNIDTWMDERQLPADPGNDYRQTIQSNIKHASVFVPIISRTLEPLVRMPRFLWREWGIAEDAAKERSKAVRYLQPLVIDDTPSGAEFVGSPYRDVQWARLADGNVPPEFIASLNREIREYRRPR